jgi:hypothetical protein
LRQAARGGAHPRVPPRRRAPPPAPPPPAISRPRPRRRCRRLRLPPGSGPAAHELHPGSQMGPWASFGCLRRRRARYALRMRRIEGTCQRSRCGGARC